MRDLIERLLDDEKGGGSDAHEAAAEIERLRRERVMDDRATVGQLLIERELRAEIERLRADHLATLKLSHEWMAKHDKLLGFIQARPAVLKELIDDAHATNDRDCGGKVEDGSG